MYPSAATPSGVEKSPFSIYPVKKRISAELEHASRQPDESTDAQKERVLAEKQSYNVYPTSLSQHILPPNPFSSADSCSRMGPSSVPISLAHHSPHPHPHHFLNSYSDNLLLSANPYFRKDVYVPSQAVGAAPQPSAVSQAAARISPLFAQQPDAPPVGVYSAAAGEMSASRYAASRQSAPLVGTGAYDRNGGVAGGGTALDFTTASASSPSSASSLPAAGKSAADGYNAQFLHSRFHPSPRSEGGVLNFSGKNLSQSSPIYAGAHVGNEAAADRTTRMQSPLAHYHQPPAIGASDVAGNNDGAGGMHLAAESMYRANSAMLENKLSSAAAAAAVDYRGAAPYHNAPNAEYFNDGKIGGGAAYRSADLRYSNLNFCLAGDEKPPYYSVTRAKNGNGVVVDANNANAAHSQAGAFDDHRLRANGATAPTSSGPRYDVSSYRNHRAGAILPMPPQSVAASSASDLSSTLTSAGAAATTTKSGRSKSKKKKTTSASTAVDSTEPSAQSAAVAASVYSRFLGANQTASSVAAAAAAAAAAASQDLKRNGLIGSGTFNFGTPPSVVQKEYHPYFDNLRCQRYLGGSGADAGEISSAGSVADKSSPSPAMNHPSSSSSSASSSSFQFLTQRSTPPFSLAAQAFINASATPPPCGPPPPSIYSSPYLQRPPDELLRPMMLPQGLMSAHTSAYPPHPHPPPHGYINMHDPVNRSPWL